MDRLALADLILALHVAYVAFVVLGAALIIAGGVRGWRWVRNFYFRAAHLAAIALVAAESIAGIPCPLTVAEATLRERAGGVGYGGGGFIVYFLHRLIFFDLPSWIFTVAYIAFGALVIALFWAVPPILPGRGRRPGKSGGAT